VFGSVNTFFRIDDYDNGKLFKVNNVPKLISFFTKLKISAHTAILKVWANTEKILKLILAPNQKTTVSR
jgi:hypothetical protein